MKNLLRILFPLVLGAWIVFNFGEADAADKKPSFLSGQTLDTTKTDKASKTIIEYVIYFGMLGAALTIAVGAIMLLKLTGKQAMGWGMIGSGIGVFIIMGVMWGLLGTVSSLTGG